MSDLVQELRARNAYLSLDEAADRTAFLAADSASACEHSNPEPWKLADGRAGWRCESCGAEFRLTDDGAITMNADQPCDVHTGGCDGRHEIYGPQPKSPEEGK